MSYKMQVVFDTIYHCATALGEQGLNLLYLHVPVAVLALIVSLYIYKQSREKWSSKIIIYISLFFAAWVVLNNLVWLGAASPDVFVFGWSLVEPVSIVLFVLMYYFVYTYTYDRDLPVISKYMIVAITLPYLVTSFTRLNIDSYNLVTCLPEENLLYLYYAFGLKVFFTLLTFYYLLYATISTKLRKRETITLSFGVLSFIFSFFASSYIAESTGNYVYEFYSLFGVVVFLISISVLVVKFRVFNIKGLGIQIIVFLQIFFVASQLLFFKSSENLTVILITLLISVIFGALLLYTVKEELRQKARQEVQSDALKKMNQKLEIKDKVRSEFMLLASHQLRSPLTAIRGYASMIKEGSFGKYDNKLEEPINRIYESATHLNNVVTDLLSISKIELGGLTYSMQVFDLKRMIKDIVDELRTLSDRKGLTLDFKDDGDILYLVKGDVEKLRQVFVNIIDNSIKYTGTGSINVKIYRGNESVIVEVRDTGVGFVSGAEKNFFKKFMRGDGVNINRSGSGVGLYLAKKIIDAHEGAIAARSDGKGKGSVFSVTLPTKE